MLLLAAERVEAEYLDIADKAASELLLEVRNTISYLTFTPFGHARSNRQAKGYLHESNESNQLCLLHDRVRLS